MEQMDWGSVSVPGGLGGGGAMGIRIRMHLGVRRVLEWKVLRGVEAWTSVHVDADMDAEKEKGMKGLGC